MGLLDGASVASWLFSSVWIHENSEDVAVDELVAVALEVSVLVPDDVKAIERDGVLDGVKELVKLGVVEEEPVRERVLEESVDGETCGVFVSEEDREGLNVIEREFVTVGLPLWYKVALWVWNTLLSLTYSNLRTRRPDSTWMVA